MKNVSREKLIELYVDENKTDSQIAEMFSTTINTIYLLRKKYCIKGINARHRKLHDNPQSPISERQMSILIGTLLGDGCLKGGESSAYLSISHAKKQKEYLEWKYQEFASFCPTPPKEYLSKNGKYTTCYFASESRKDLKTIRDKIYIPNKTVNQWWIDQIDALALSVWFMDDGCLSYVNKGKSEFSFATNSFSDKENYLLARVLKEKFNIIADVRPYNKKNGIQYNIFINDSSFNLFLETISPFIINSMKYKIPSEESIKGWQNRIETNIDKEGLEKLYYEERMTYDEIASRLSVHKGTVRKYMSLFGIKCRDSIEAQLSGKNNKCKRMIDGRFSEISLGDEEKRRAEELYLEMKASSFPYIEKKDDNHYIGIVDRLLNSGSGIKTDDFTFSYSRAGNDICSAFCPQIFSMASIGSLSPIEIFNNDEMFRDCIKRTIRYAKKDTKVAVRQGLKTYRNNRCVTVFPPSWAKTIIREVEKEKNGLSVLDFSCGFGGRMVGSYASGKVSRYVGIDPLIENINSHVEIEKILKKHSDLRSINFSTELINGMAEDILPIISENFDVVMTSPPYFSKEIYSKEISQCYVKYPDFQSWEKEWLFKVLGLSYNLLKPNGKMIIFASNYDKYLVGESCNKFLCEISGKKTVLYRFEIPSIEYLRTNGKKKYDSCWVVSK